MFITTKSEFIWDGDKYVETHTEGYEYEGELSLAYGQDDLYSREDQYGQSTSTSTTGSTGPSLQDLTSKDVATIMADMGLTRQILKNTLDISLNLTRGNLITLEKKKEWG